MAILNLTPPKLNILGFFEGQDFVSQLRAREVENQLRIAQANRVNSETAYLRGSLDSRVRLSGTQADQAALELNVGEQTLLDATVADINLRQQQAAAQAASAELTQAQAVTEAETGVSSELALQQQRRAAAGQSSATATQTRTITELTNDCANGDRSACIAIGRLQGNQGGATLNLGSLGGGASSTNASTTGSTSQQSTNTGGIFNTDTNGGILPDTPTLELGN